MAATQETVDQQGVVHSPAAMRRLVADLFRVRPLVYWADFLASAFIGWGAFTLALGTAGWGRAVWTVVAGLALYRAVVFTHELTHLRRGAVPGFLWTWNLLCGIPLMVPSFMYRGVHSAHHVKKLYGTAADGEYLPFAARHPLHMVGYLASNLVLPPLAAARFVILAPLSLVHPRLRRLVMQRASSLAIDAAYLRPLPTGAELRDARLQEAAACVFGAVVLGTVAADLWPAALLVQWYAVAVLILLANAVRTLAAHRYRNTGGPLPFVEQIRDSINVTGQPLLMTLIAPLGMRYHALHHLFPSLPYHALGAAHRRLMAALPADSWYRDCNRDSLFAALAELWRTARRRDRRPSCPDCCTNR